MAGMTDQVFQAELVARLNNLVKEEDVLDDVQALLEVRVKASKATIEHPSLTVSGDGELGLMGLLNGLLTKGNRIASICDDPSGTLLGFTAWPQ